MTPIRNKAPDGQEGPPGAEAETENEAELEPEPEPELKNLTPPERRAHS